MLGGLAPGVLAFNKSEPPDFSNTSPGSTYTLDLGTNTFSGAVSTPSDGQDNFQVTVPAGARMTLATKNFVDGGGVQSPACTFNTESLSGTGTGTFTMGYPLPAGTYQATISAGFSVGNAWTNTFVLGPTPDIAVTVASGSITVSENSANSMVLNVSQPSAGNVTFAATNRTFTVNNGPLLTNVTGSISLTGVTGLQISMGNGSNTVNVGAFTGTTFPGVTIYCGTNYNTVNLNGSITFASGNSLDIELQNDTPATNSITVSNNVQLVTSGTGAITMLASRNVALSSGALLQVQNGDLDVEANQQAQPTTGNFTSLNLDGATLRSTGTGYVYAFGTGGNDSGGYQLGVQVINGAQIIGGSGFVIVNGNGGNSTGQVNRGVTVYGTGSTITSSSGSVYVTGVAGTNGSYYGIGLSVLFGGQISAGGTGQVQINCTGAGQAGSGYDQGLEMGSAGSLITSGGGAVTINATAGPGVNSGLSAGIYLVNSSAITTPTAGGNITLNSDSDIFDSTIDIITTNHASSVTFETGTFGTHVFLGAGGNSTGSPNTLALTDAELDRVNTAILYLGLNSGGVYILAPITHPYATNFVILPGLNGSLYSLVSGTDISLVNNGTVTLQFGSAAFQISGPAAESGYPPLTVSGRVAINGCSLNVSNSTYSCKPGDVFTIINNTGSLPVTGTFQGLPQGSFLKVNGQPVRIFYNGGDGNDVVLVSAQPKLSAGGLTNGQWHLNAFAFPTNTFTIQVTTNFITWTNLGTAATDTNGNMTFTDSNAFKFPYRFYRVTN